ncbi:MAG TPA: alpha-amylase family glycosyl hydrolase [Streptosporangiaceae bacterium]|nr:alpha-amylase family glycosyl hydrolase [Streptosporangiaceae bacterium]
MAVTAPSTRPGMGSVPFPGGVTFRVWAPDASAAAVVLAQPGGGSSSVPLAAEAGGIWSADVDGVGTGQQYQYVLTTSAVPLTRVDPYARNVVEGGSGDAGAAVVYDEQAFDWGTAGWNSPGWTELVIYELHVGSFSVQPGAAVGTFADVIARLPYLQSLGINAIELLPVAEFEGTYGWGYDPGAPFAVAVGYGGPDGLKNLVRAAHEAGIAVILDVVYNHFGPPGSILWVFDGQGPGWEGGIYFYGTRWPGDGRPQAGGWGSRPDYGRPEVRQFIRDNALAWLQDYRVDGLRFDATAWIRSIDGSGSADQAIPDGSLLLQEVNGDIDLAQPWKLTIAEDLRGDASITAPVSRGGSGFDSQWDSDFLWAVRQTAEATSDDQRDMNLIAAQLQRRFGAAASTRVIYTESHDADGNGRTRLPAEIDPAQPDSWWSKKRSTLAAALVFTAPGIPMIFQGQEFLDQDPFVQEPIPPLDWADATKYAGIVQLYRDLIQLRRDWHDTTRGLKGDGLNVFHINNTGKLIAYHRWSQGGPLDDVVVALNFANRGYSSYTIGLPRTGRWRVRFNSDWAGYDPSFGNWPGYDTDTDQGAIDGLPAAANIGIGPYTALILSQDP